MLQIFLSLVVLSGLCFGLIEAGDAQVITACPPWTAYNKNHTCTCAAGFMGHLLYCSQSAKGIEAGVLVGFCLTWNTQKTEVVVGSCPFNIIIHPQFGSYTPVPNNLSQLDRAVCNYTHRTGQLCGQCANGTSPPVYSYYPQCVDCPAGTNNWAKYLAVSLLPTTLFFLGAIALKASSSLPTHELLHSSLPNICFTKYS